MAVTGTSFGASSDGLQTVLLYVSHALTILIVMNDSTLKDRPMTDSDTPLDVVKDTQKSTAKTEFSLTSGAKRVGLSRNVLRDATIAGELPFRMNAKGHYVIEHDQLIEWKKNRDEDAERDRLKTVFVPEVNVRPDVPKDGVRDASRRTSETGSETVSRRSDDKIDEDTPAVKILLQSQEIKSLKTQLQKTEAAFDDFRNYAEKSMQALITDQSQKPEIQPDINLSPAGQGGHFWRNMAAVLVVVALVGAALYFRPDIAGQWAKFTTAEDVSSTAAESDSPQG